MEDVPEFGIEVAIAVRDPSQITPVWWISVVATVLHLLGIDHEQLTYRYAGRDFRLTDVHGKVATGIFM